MNQRSQSAVPVQFYPVVAILAVLISAGVMWGQFVSPVRTSSAAVRVQTLQSASSSAARTTYTAHILRTSLTGKGKDTTELVVQPAGSSSRVRLIVASGARIAVPWNDRYVAGTVDDLIDGQSVLLVLMPGATFTNGAAIASLRIDAGVLDGSHTS